MLGLLSLNNRLRALIAKKKQNADQVTFVERKQGVSVSFQPITATDIELEHFINTKIDTLVSDNSPNKIEIEDITVGIVDRQIEETDKDYLITITYIIGERANG